MVKAIPASQRNRYTRCWLLIPASYQSLISVPCPSLKLKPTVSNYLSPCNPCQNFYPAVHCLLSIPLTVRSFECKDINGSLHSPVSPLNVFSDQILIWTYTCLNSYLCFFDPLLRLHSIMLGSRRN